MSYIFDYCLHKSFAAAVLTVSLGGQAWANGQIASLPNPTDDESITKTSSQQSAVFAGGCFWSVQAVFQHVNGVITTTAGYAGGAASSAHYEQVSSGTTGHAESVEIIYDPARISYGRLLKIYFSVAHNPTQHNRQGPDIGTQYRSRIFAVNFGQKRMAESYISQLAAANIYPEKIMTKVTYLSGFYPAENFHQIMQ